MREAREDLECLGSEMRCLGGALEVLWAYIGVPLVVIGNLKGIIGVGSWEWHGDALGVSLGALRFHEASGLIRLHHTWYYSFLRCR